MKRIIAIAVVALVAGCTSPEGSGLMKTAPGTGAEVKFDVFHRPLPEIPLPNDFATRFDATSPTRKRINASMLAPTKWEKATREVLDQLDGWGTYQTITVGFTRPLDLHNIIRRHQGDDYAPGDDAVYLIDITPDSPDYCQRVPLDMGEGNFPLTLERPTYFSNDRAGEQLLFEDTEEDLNRNGVLDPGEDLDMDGVLDHPNTLHPNTSSFDVLTFYERETNTLLLKPVMPLRENTTYAVVLTRRLVDEDGRPVRSPFAYINHTSQTETLKPLDPCLPRYGLGLPDVAFTWAYSTMSVSRDFVAIRDGLYGLGPLQRLATEFPDQVKELLTLRDETGPNTAVNVRVVPGEVFRQAAIDLLKSMSSGGNLSPQYQAVIDSHKFIDFHVVFSFESPQFFRRVDSEGRPLPLYRQVFEVDPVTGAAFTRPETVYVWLTVPKGRRGPAPVVVLGHGYTGNKLDPLFYGGYFARYGMASIGMENVSHGIGLPKDDLELGRALLASKGLGNMFDALVKNDRAFDQNGDGVKDSAADFWTSYILHTRDVVRQTAIDYMQLVRVLRGFNGLNTWKYNKKDGKDGLAGDFDGDGVIDVGGTAAINITGGSLGGIMSAMMAGVEPQIDLAIPVSGGAGLPDIGVRSIQGGVREAVNLRMLGPLLVTVKNSAGELELWTELPDLNDLGRRKLANVTTPLLEGDTAVLFNLTTGEHRCFRVGKDGLLRAAISSDEGDQYKLAVYSGALPPKERDGCSVPEDARAYWTVEKTEFDFTWYGREHNAGEALSALGDGFGLRRQSPELRRFLGLAQLAIEQGDPVNYLQNVERRRILRYGTGEEVSTRMIVVNTVGDMNVPVATGAAIARAAGMIELFKKDSRWGKTENRVLIDTGTIEAVERTGRWKNSRGQDVHMDIDHLSAIAGKDDGFDVPRLDPPYRLVKDSDRVGGKTGVLFPMVVPTGRHGFDPPNPGDMFDLGSLMMNMLGRYMQSGGTELPMEACMEDNSCSWIPPIPAD
ncbi:MAG: hypothetical protein AB1730_03055 [Myxococcota bacterium]